MRDNIVLGSDIDHNDVTCYTVIYAKQIHSAREHREALKLYVSSPMYSEVQAGEMFKHECKYNKEERIPVQHDCG